MRPLGDTNPIWLVSLEEEIWIHRHHDCAHREERPFENTVRRWPSESQGERPQMKPNLTTPWSRTSCHQNWENKLLFKLPSLWYFVIICLASYIIQQTLNYHINTSEVTIETKVMILIRHAPDQIDLEQLPLQHTH